MKQILPITHHIKIVCKRYSARATACGQYSRHCIFKLISIHQSIGLPRHSYILSCIIVSPFLNAHVKIMQCHLTSPYARVLLSCNIIRLWSNTHWITLLAVRLMRLSRRIISLLLRLSRFSQINRYKFKSPHTQKTHPDRRSSSRISRQLLLFALTSRRVCGSIRRNPKTQLAQKVSI